jgi:ferric enterobactin receptor
VYRFLLLLLLSPVCFAQSFTKLNGVVKDAQNKPIEFANIFVVETNSTTYTNAKGEFNISQRQLDNGSVTLRISFVGKQTITQTITKNDLNKPLLIVLQDLSLTLKEVVVTAQRKRSEISNSAINFDRQAIEQIQAYSLADVLNNLPGKKMSAPDLQYRQNITLRSAAATNDKVQEAVNSLGVAIYVDGFRQANDANMQNRNVGLQGMIGSAINNHKDPFELNPTYDTPFSGIDIRSIPADNIESIEVVSGVASAKYGEITDGAIIINRMAGKTPYQFSMRLNGSSTNYSLSKGIALGPKAGALNISLNYLNSVQDPRNSLKNYRRTNAGLMWTTNLSSNFRNTLSVDYAYKNDNAAVDPDDGTEQSTISLDRKISVTNRSTLKLQSKYLNSITLGVNFDKGYSNSYNQFYVNKAVMPVADKDTTGIYEGYYIPGNYLAIDHIIGEPYNFGTNLDLGNNFKTGKVSHTLSLGMSFYTAGNNGQGIIADPNFPARGTTGSKSERPYNFDLQRTILNTGFYLQDQAKYMLFGHMATANAGIRYDLQNGFPSVQPRINTTYELSDKWSLRAAYGISTKAPGMAQRYPAPTYFDIPLINIYNGYVNESLFLVYTQKIQHDNTDLKPSRSTQLELGVTADYHFFNTSLYGYVKRNRDGFNTATNYLTVSLPVYTYTTLPGQKPTYQATPGQYKLYSGLSDNVIGNNAQSDNYGVEWFVSTKKIEAIQTSFNMNTSVSYSRSNNVGFSITEADVSYREANRTAWYGIYPATKSANLYITSKLSTDTHIPKLGFVVTVLADIYWKNKQQVLGRSAEPVAYLDRYSNYFPITQFDPNNVDYGYLALSPQKANTTQMPPFVYGNLSLRLAKEIKKQIRFAVYAYNFLNIIPQYYNTTTASFSTYNNPVNVGGEISIKF